MRTTPTIRAWKKRLKGTGCTITVTRGGHLCITCPNGYRYFTGATPSDRRATINAIKDISRHGGVELRV